MVILGNYYEDNYKTATTTANKSMGFDLSAIVQLESKLNTKLRFNTTTHHPPTTHSYFLTSSGQSGRLRFGVKASFRLGI